MLPLSPKQHLRSKLFWIYVVVFLDLLAVGIIIPAISTKYKELSISVIDQGKIGSCYFLTQFIFNPIIGQMSDTYGRRTVLYMSLLGSAVSYLILGYASSAAMMVLSRLLVGVLKQTVTVTRAYITDTCEPHEIQEAFIDTSTIIGVAFIVGPILGSLLSFAGTHFTGLLSASLFLLDMILIYNYFPHEPHKTNFKAQPLNPIITPTTWTTEVKSFISNFDKIWNTPLAFQYLLLRFVQSFATSIQRSTYPSVIEYFDYPPSTMGYILSYFGLIGVISSVLMKRITNHMEDPNSISYCLLFAAVLTVVMSHVTYFPLFLFLAPLNQFALTVIATVTISIYSALFAKENTGVALGIIGSAESIGGIVGPLLGGYLFEYGGIHLTYLACAFLCLFPLLIRYIQKDVETISSKLKVK